MSSDKREVSAKSFLVLPLSESAIHKHKPKFRGCAQRPLRASITRELFVVENIQSPTTFSYTNRTYRTISRGHFMSLCLFMALLNVVSLMSEIKRNKQIGFCRSIQISFLKSLDTNLNSPEPCNTSLMVTCSKVTNLLQQLCQPLHRVTYRTFPVMEAVMSTLGWVILFLREVFPYIYILIKFLLFVSPVMHRMERFVINLLQYYVYWTLHHLDS